MSPEEFERIKEAEKEHLRALKQLKSTARKLERRQKISRSLESLVSSSQDALDAHEEQMRQLALETAWHEARLDLALDRADEPAEETGTGRPADAALEEEMLRIRAQALLRRLQAEVDAPSESSSEPPPEISPAENDVPGDPPSASDDLPEKTIGRMK